MIIWENKKIPCFYVLIYKLAKEKSKNNLFISYSCFKQVMRRTLFNVPRVYHYQILKEMEELKLIESMGPKNKLSFKLIGKDIDKCLNSHFLLD